MKYLFFMLSCVFILPAIAGRPGKPFSIKANVAPVSVLHLLKGGSTAIKIPAIEFKAQKYCRAEPDENFDFDVHFTVVSADVYFTGANFLNTPVKGTITSNSLDPVRTFMDRCMPGTIVIFDKIKVKGPDNIVRTIKDESFTLF